MIGLATSGLATEGAAINARTQKGYALLAIVVVLLGVGGSWLNSIPVQIRSGTHNSLPADQQALVDARQSLVSYSALYPYLYGPTGAGPGHLPCPDTDARIHSNSLAAPRGDYRLDGPNPPCADPVQSAGYLPRHTVLPGHRYLFHAQPWQRFRYLVAGSFVNNPLNRPVNLSRLNQAQQLLPATMSVLSFDESRVLARVAITRRALAAGVVPAFTMWLTHRVNSQPTVVCADIAVRRQGAARNDRFTDRLAASASHSPECIAHIIDSESECPFNAVFTHLLDRPVVGNQPCLKDLLGANTIEGVPAQRHWFVKNDWVSSVVIRQHPSCQSDLVAVGNCRLVSAADSGDSVDKTGSDEFLQLSWVGI